MDIGGGENGIARFFHLVVERTHRGALAHDFERDALLDIAHAAAVFDQRFRGPAEHVDESRRDCQSVEVDDGGGGVVAQVADCAMRSPVMRMSPVTGGAPVPS